MTGSAKLNQFKHNFFKNAIPAHEEEKDLNL